jgi:hypothetical protein
MWEENFISSHFVYMELKIWQIIHFLNAGKTLSWRTILFSVNLGDGTYKIFFNAKECDKMESAEEKSFFNFIKGSNPDTEFTKQLSEKLLLARCN